MSSNTDPIQLASDALTTLFKADHQQKD